MKSQLIKENKKQFLDLLLIADEQEDMIDKYINIGEMHVFYENAELIGQCVVVKEEGFYELKSISVYEKFRRKGFGRKIVEFVIANYGGKIIVGTGEVPSSLNFYESCGFSYSHRIENFFTDNYSEPIYEDGILLEDMVYLSTFKLCNKRTPRCNIL